MGSFWEKGCATRTAPPMCAPRLRRPASRSINSKPRRRAPRAARPCPAWSRSRQKIDRSRTSTGRWGWLTCSGVPSPDRDPQPELLPDIFLRWFAGRGWSPREHQLALLAKARDDRSALLIAPTGAGKTLARFLPTLVELSGLDERLRSSPLPPRSGGE